MSLSQTDRIARIRNRNLYADYLTQLTAYNNGTRTTPPSFKGDTSLSLQIKIGRLATEISEENSYLVSATRPPAPLSSLSIRPTATANSITLSFPANPAATSYTYVLNGVPIVPAMDNSLQGTVTFDSLVPGSENILVVTTTGPSGSSTSAPIKIYTLPIAPPLSSFQQIPSPGGVTIGWAGGAGALSYTYTVKDSTGNIVTGYSIQDNSASGNSALTGLPAGQQFTVTLHSTNPSGTVSSAPFSVTTAPSVPTTAPVPITATQTSFTIPSPSVPGALSYTYSINGNAVTPTTIGGVVTFSGLTPGQAQNLIVTAIGPNNTQTPSAPFSLHTAPVPLVPSSITTTAMNSNDVTISWPSSANSGTTSYTYVLRDLSGNPIPGATVIDNGLRNSSATITGLPAGGEYTLTVVSQNPSGSSSTPLTIYTPPAPSDPTESSFSIPIPSISGSVNYIYKINGSVIAAAPAVPGFSISGGKVTFTGLSPGMAQRLVVTSVDSNNVQTSTPSLTVYTSPVTVPASSFSTNTSNQNGITVDWPAGSGATSYTYAITDLAGNPIPNVVVTDDGVIGNTATISGLTPGTQYIVTVTGINASGAAIPTTITASTAPPTPPQPVPTGTSQTGFSIPVPSVTGANDYIYSINNVVVYPNIVNGVATFSGLTPGVAQNLVVTAVGPNNVSTASPPYTVYTTPVTLPTTNFNTSDSTSTELNVTWSGYTGATSYRYEVLDTSGNPIPGANVRDNGVTSNTATVTGLTPGTQYTVRVTPINPSGQGAPVTLTAYTAPPAPATPTASAPTQTGFTIPAPSPPASGSVTSYIYTVNNVQYTPTVSGGNLVFTGLPPGVPQNLVVTAVGQNNTQTPSPPVTVYTTPVALPPSAFTTNTSTPTALNIAWTGVTGATSYTYEVKDASGNVIPGAVVTDNVASNTATVTGLAPGTEYTVTVTANNPSGTSTPTVINASTAPPAPSPPVPSAPTQTGFTIPAPSVVGASSYTYKVNGVTVTPTVSGGNLVFTGLTPGVAQSLVVTAVGPNNTQTSSSPLTVYTSPVPIVASSMTTQATSNSIVVSWPPNSGATSYTYDVLDASGDVIPGITVVDNGVGFNSATVIGLAPGTVYSLRVTPTNPSGTATSTTVSMNTAPRIPALPTASASTVDGFTINAPSSPGALSYIYKINDAVIDPAPAVPGYSVSGGNVVFAGLTPGIPQVLVVTAVGPNNSQTTCAPITVYTLPVTLPVSAFTTTTASSTDVTIKWTGVTGATSYTYEVKDANGNVIPGAVVTDNLASNSATVTGLAPGTQYAVTVTANNPSGTSTPTTITTYTTPATPPQPTPSAPSQTGFSIPAPSVAGALSYTYLVNGVSVTPTVSGGNLAFTGLTPGIIQTLVVTAVGPNNIQTSSAPLTVYTAPVPIVASSVTTQATASGGTISWPAGSGATSYTYAVVDASGNPIPGISVVDNGVTSNSATVTGVPPGTIYSVQVTGRNPSGATTPTTITATTAPSTPPPSTPIAPTETGFSISAPSTPGALSYIYTINGTTVTPTVTNGVVTFSGLQPAVPQTLIITAVGPNNTRTSSAPIQALTTPVSLPSSSFSTPTSSANGVTVRWSGTTGATAYTYDVKDQSGNPVRGFTVNDNGVSSNFATITGLAPGVQYNISVTARNAAGASTPTTFTSYTAPEVPSQSRTTATTTTSFTIPAPSAAGALSYTYTINGTTVTPTVSGGNLVFTGLTPGVTQRLITTAVGLNNLRTSTTPQTIYTEPVSLPLNAFTTTDSSPTGFTIQWAGLTGATAYSYTITDGSGVAVPTANMTDNGLSTNSVSFGGLSVGIGYRVTLSSINPSGSVASATYIGYTGPSTPSSFSTSSSSQTGFTVSWAGGIGATSYTYELDGSGAIPHQNNGISAKNAVFRNLVPGKSYIVKVTARDNYGSSSSATYTTVTAPSNVTNVTETAATLTGFTLSWSGGNAATSYKYYIGGAYVTPSVDNGVSGKTATFSGLTIDNAAISTGLNVIVTAVNSSGENGASVRGYPLTPPATNLVSSAITSDGFTVSWADIYGANIFTLNGTTTVPSVLTPTSAIFNNLNPGTLYVVIVNTDNPAPGVTPSEPISITTTVAPSQPSIDSSSVPDADITSAGFKVVLPTVTGGTAPITFNYSVIASGNSIGVSSSVLNGIATLTGLLPNTDYTVSVIAVDSVGTLSVPSTPYAFRTLPAAKQPISLVGTPSITSLTVSWSLDSIGSDPVYYTYTLNNVLKTGSSSTSSPVTFSGLTLDTPYSIIVKAIDQYGSATASAALSMRTLQSLPLLPTSLTFPSANIGNTTALLTWSGGDYASSYNFVVTNSTVGTIVTPTIVTYLTNVNLAANSAQISGLLAGFSYSITIQGVNSFGNSPVSAPASVTTTVLVTTFATGLLGPTAMTTDGTNLYVAQAPSNFSQDTTNNIMKIDSAGNVTSILSGAARATVYNAGKTAITTQGGVFGVTYVPLRSPPLIFTDFNNNVIKACELDGTGVTTILGNGAIGTFLSGTGTAARFYNPTAIISDSTGNLYFSERWNNNPVKVSLTNDAITTGTGMLAGTSHVYDTITNSMWSSTTGSLIHQLNLSPPNSTRNYYAGGSYLFNKPKGITMDMYGNIIVADTSNNRISLIYTYGRSIVYNGVTLTAAPFTGAQADTANNVIIYAGSGASGSVNDTLLNSTFNAPWGVQLSSDNTTLYVTDNGNGTVRSMPYVIYTIISSLRPVTPTNIVQVSGPPNEFVISWTGGLQATSYTYLIKDSSDNTVYSSVSTSTVTLVTDSVVNKKASFSGLTYGQTYTVTVTAVNENGSTDSTATSIQFKIIPYVLVSGLTDSPRLITVDSSNTVYITTSIASAFRIKSFTSSGTSGTISPTGTNVVNNYAGYFAYSLIRNMLLLTNSVSRTTGFSADLQSQSQIILAPINYCDKNGNIYSHSGTTITKYDITNTLVKTVTSTSLNNSNFIVVFNTYWISYNRYINPQYVQFIANLDKNGNLINEYAIPGNYGTNLNYTITSDRYDNIIIAVVNKIFIYYRHSSAFTYNGTTYTSGQFIDYTLINDITVNFSNISFTLSFDTTFTNLYILDGMSSIKIIPYIIKKSPSDIFNISIITGSTTSLTIGWEGGGGVTSYSYTFTDSSGNPVSVSVSTDNGLTDKIIVVSGSFTIGFSFNISITATNEYGNTTNNQDLIITGFVSTFATGFSSPSAITFDNNNLLYVTQAVNPTATYPNITSIASDGVTKTTIVSTFAQSPSGLAYNPILGLLILADFGNGRLWTSGLTPAGPTQRDSSIIGVRGCVVDSYGNTYVINTNTGNVSKYSTTYVKTTAILQTTASFSAPYSITIDNVGNLWVTDTGNNGIKKFSNSGTLLQTYTGFNQPRGITSDKFGNIIVADTSNNLIKIIYTYPTTHTLAGVTYTAVTSGLCNIYTYAGSGASGSDNIQLLTSSFKNPWGIQLDNTGAVLYVADSGNGVIRSMPYALNNLLPLPPTQPTNIVNTIGTSSTFSFSWSDVFGATSYSYSATDSDMNPVSLSVITDNGLASQNVTLGGTFDLGKSYIFTITPVNTGGSTPATLTTGTIGVFITNYKTGLNTPTQITFGPSNILYFSQFAGNNIFSITPSGTLTNLVTTFMAKVYGVSYDFKFNRLIMVDAHNGRITTTPLTGGEPASITSGILRGCVCDTFGNTYFTQSGSAQLVKLTGTTKTNFGPTYNNANGITLDPFDNLWVANTFGNTVVKHTITGTVLDTYVGFNAPSGLCSDSLGNIIVADSSNNVIKIIYTHSTPITVNGVTYTAGNVYTYAGSGISGNTASSLLLTRFNNPWSAQLDLTNTTLYVTDYGNNSIRSMPYLLCSTPLSIETLYAPVAVTFNTPTITGTGFTLSWTPGKYIQSYTYAFSTSAGTVTPTVTDNGFSANNIVVSGLTDVTAYTVTVTGRNNFTSTTTSSTTTITTPYDIGVKFLRGSSGIGIITGPGTTLTAQASQFITKDSSNNIYFSAGFQFFANSSYTTGYYIMTYVNYSTVPTDIFFTGVGNAIICIINDYLYACLPNRNILVAPVGSGGFTVFATIPSPDYGAYISPDPVNAGSFYVSTNLGAIYKIDSAGTVTLFANATTLGLATSELNKAIAADNLGNIYYIKNSTTSLMKITQDLTVSPVTAGVSGSGMKFTSDYSTLYIAYTFAHKIMKYVVSTNTLTTFAGTGTSGSANTSNLLTSTFNGPRDLEIHSSLNYIYVTESTNIRKITFN